MSHPPRARSKILSIAKARGRIRGARRTGQRVVFTNGCFDWLHAGHVRSLEQARGMGDRLLVALNSDASTRRLKGAGRPLVPGRQRAEVIAALACVDWVVLFSEADASPLIRALRPDVVCKGGEYRRARTPEEEAIVELGGRFVALRKTPSVRTSAMLARARRR